MNFSDTDNIFMDMALEEAQASFERDEVPVGAVIVSACGEVLSRSHNRCLSDCDPTAHAELLAIRSACNFSGLSRLAGCSLYVTLEPCAMCSAAISYARILNLYFGVWDKRAGGISGGLYFDNWELCRHRPRVYSGIRQKQCRELLDRFFAKKR